MCDKHEFTFDVDRAFADQLVATLEGSPEHPLADPEASRECGIYVLYRAPNKKPIYVGQAVGEGGVATRLRDHLKQIQHREGISVDDMTCRYLFITNEWEVLRAEEAVITRYKPGWNGMPGFGVRVPVRGRPGMPAHINEWDRLFPRLP